LRHLLIAIDFRGHGRSSKIEGKIKLGDLADDVAAVIKDEDLVSAHIVGVSMGGMVAQHLALSYPRLVRSLILCSTASTFPEAFRSVIRGRGEFNANAGMQSIVQSTLEGWFSPATQSSELAKQCTERLLRNDPHSWSACWEAISRLNTLPELSHLNCPALVVAGACDARTPPSAAAQIAEAVAGSTLVTIPEAFHMGAFENPAQFLSVFSRFLADRTDERAS
jgi:3-oxoadipate enol-lactonase